MCLLVRLLPVIKPVVCHIACALVRILLGICLFPMLNERALVNMPEATALGMWVHYHKLANIFTCNESSLHNTISVCSWVSDQLKNLFTGEIHGEFFTGDLFTRLFAGLHMVNISAWLSHGSDMGAYSVFWPITVAMSTPFKPISVHNSNQCTQYIWIDFQSLVSGLRLSLYPIHLTLALRTLLCIYILSVYFDLAPLNIGCIAHTLTTIFHTYMLHNALTSIYCMWISELQEL